MAEEVTKVVEDVDKLFSEIVVNGESHVSDRYTPPEPVQSTPVSTNQEEEVTPVQTQEPVQGQYVEAVNLNNVIHDFKDTPLTQEVTAIQQAITALQGRLNDLVTAINGINAKIPAQASAQNQLADKSFVNSSIATNTANFLGTYTSLAEIEAIPNPTNNDYAFLETTDSAGNTLYDRYKYSGEDEEWLFEYELNNSGFTAEQWATINSGLTSGSITDAINALDVPSTGGSGKYIKSISEADGKISAEEGTIDSVVTQDSANPVSGGAVAEMFKGTNPQTLHDDDDGSVTMQTIGKLAVFNISRKTTRQKDYVIPEVNVAGYSSVPLMVQGKTNGEAYFQTSTTLRSKLTGVVSSSWGAGQLIGFLR